MSHREAFRAFVLRPIPPFRLDFTVWALRRRQRNLIDRWDGSTYRRVICDGRTADRTGRAAGWFVSGAEADRDGNTAASDAGGDSRRARLSIGCLAFGLI